MLQTVDWRAVARDHFSVRPAFRVGNALHHCQRQEPPAAGPPVADARFLDACIELAPDVPGLRERAQAECDRAWSRFELRRQG